MRLRPTLIELSLERRDSMRISRSRLASCAACGAARAPPAPPRGAPRARPSSSARRESSASSATRPRSSSARARASASCARPISRATSAASSSRRSRRSVDSCERARSPSSWPSRSAWSRCAPWMRLCAASRSRSALRQLLAAGGESALRMSRVFSSLRASSTRSCLSALFALEHAGVRIAAAIDAQPVAADPLTRAGDDRFVVRELAAHAQRLGQRFRRGALATAGARSRRAADHARQHARRCRRLRRARRPAAATCGPTGKLGQHAGDVIELVDAQRLRDSRRARFRRRVPSRRSPTAARRDAAACRGPELVEPLGGARIAAPQRRLLQGLERHHFGAARARDRCALLRGALRRRTARRAASASDRARAVERAATSSSARAARRWIPSRRAGRAAPEDSCAISASRSTARRSACAGEAAQLVLQLLDARALDLRGLVRGALLAVEVLPSAAASRRAACFGGGQRSRCSVHSRRSAPARARRRAVRSSARRLGDLALVAIDVRVRARPAWRAPARARCAAARAARACA